MRFDEEEEQMVCKGTGKISRGSSCSAGECSEETDALNIEEELAKKEELEEEENRIC